MDKVILIVHVLVAVSLVVLILLQRSSADGGAAFGGGSQQSLLGTSGSAPLLTKVTVGLVTVFFVTSLTLAYFNRHYGTSEEIIIPAAETVDIDAATQEPEVTVRTIDDDDIPAVPESEEVDSDIPTPVE